MQKKDYLAPLSMVFKLKAGRALLQTSPGSPQSVTMSYRGDDDGEGEGD